MFVFRITKTKKRAADLSGTGAFRVGGRWNNKGNYMLYTSENSSLALLEVLVHLDETELPGNLFITKIKLSEKAPIRLLPKVEYPKNWMRIENAATKSAGGKFLQENKYIALKVHSAINATEFDFLLNPGHPQFSKLVKIVSVTPLKTDTRLFL